MAYNSIFRHYNIMQKTDTEEYHIFKVIKDQNGKENVLTPSICKEMNYKEGIKVNAKPLDEEETRLKACEIGRKVCGNCIRNLYTTY